MNDYRVTIMTSQFIGNERN